MAREIPKSLTERKKDFSFFDPSITLRCLFKARLEFNRPDQEKGKENAALEAGDPLLLARQVVQNVACSFIDVTR